MKVCVKEMEAITYGKWRLIPGGLNPFYTMDSLYGKAAGRCIFSLYY